MLHLARLAVEITGRVAGRWRGSILLLALAGLVGCDSEALTRISLRFDLEAAATDLFAIPYPNDSRRRPDGSLDLAHLGKGQPELIQSYMDQVARNEYRGFATNAGVFLRFDGPLDEACLPASAGESLRPGSALLWVNVEEGSPAFGRRIPFRWRFREAASRYIGENSLALLPVAGFAMEPRSRYAIILTEGICDRRGRPLLLSSTMATLLGAELPPDPELLRIHELYRPLRRYLARSNLTGVVGASLFSTGDPAGLAGLARRVVHAAAAPRAEKLVAIAQASNYLELRGTYQALNFQKGAPPYQQPRDGGAIAVDGKGLPVPARTEELRFALTVPSGAMPPAGWPIVLYAHGTGGSYRSFIHEQLPQKLASATDLDGTPLPALAMVGIDQNLHGPRDPGAGSPELNFFNFQNPAASVYNVVQAGIDDFSLLRMIRALQVSEAPWERAVPGTPPVRFEPPLRFDPQRIYFMGHSQGGLTGSVFLPHEPEVKGAMLSGAGGGAVLGLLEKTEPFAVLPLLRMALDDDVDAFHPMLSLIQQMLEPADPLNYGRMLIRNRPPGIQPKHIFLSQGLVDHYTPASTTDALAAAIGLPVVSPVLREVEALDLLSLAPAALPLSGNLNVDQEAVTGGLVQYQAQGSSDGHFVIFRDARASQHVIRFFGTMARSGVPTLGP